MSEIRRTIERRISEHAMGERSAVRPKSGQSVCQSDPGLRRPTPPVTAGRNPAARPPFIPAPSKVDDPETQPRKAEHPQPKIGRGAGQSPAVLEQREALQAYAGSSDDQTDSIGPLNDSQIAILVDYILTLHRWDLEAHGKRPM